MIKIGDDYSDYTNIEKTNSVTNYVAKLQLQFRWESEIERVGQEREHTKREREKGGKTLLTAAVGDFSGSTLLLHGGLFLQITVICHIRYVLRVLLDAQRFRVVCHLSTHEWRGVCVREGGSKRGRGILTCVNLPLAFSKSAWYFTFDWIFVFSAMRFSSGVSAIAVALALGMCLQGGKKQKKQMRRGKRARRWIRGKVQVAVGLFFDTAHFHAACCACGMLWHTVAVAARKLTLQQLLLHPHFAAPRAQQHIIGHSSWNAWTPPLPVFPLSSLLVVRKTSDPHLAVLSIKTAFLRSRWHFDTGCFSYWFSSSPASSSIFPLKATNG